jgi:TRAP-type C4-dicarboxylate transport system substrate-binding protein
MDRRQLDRRQIDRRIFLGSAVGLAATVAAPSIARAQQNFTMKFASATINDIQHEYQKRFKERVEAKTASRIKVEIYPASQLGPIPSMVDGVTLGTIEAFTTATSFLSQIDPRFNVFDVPGLFGDVDRTRQILADQGLRRRAFEFGAARGIQSVSLFLHSPNSILARRPIRTVDDLKGLKIRTLGTPMQVEPMRSLGAIPVPMPLSEVMPALQTGAIDGLISASTVVSAFRYYDVAKPLTIIPTWPLIITVAMNRRWLGRLPEDLRAIVLAEATAAEADANAWGKTDIEQAGQRWTQNGGELIPASAEFQRDLQARFLAATAPIIERSAPLKAEVEFVRSVAAKA